MTQQAPWSWHPTDIMNHFTVQNCDGELVAQNVTYENLPLITAAPELLKALEAIIWDWEHCGSPPLDGIIGLRQLRAAKAAIAKARGAR